MAAALDLLFPRPGCRRAGRSDRQTGRQGRDGPAQRARRRAHPARHRPARRGLCGGLRWRNDMTKIAPCLWFDHNAEEAANFYAETFPDSAVKAVHRSPSDYPDGKAGDALTVEFTVLGLDFIGLNGGPIFKFDEALSFQIYTDDQAETDRYWNAIVDNK